MERRSFLKLTAAGAGAALAGIKSSAAADAPVAAPLKAKATVAIPIAVGPLARNPLDPMLEDMRTRAGINVLMPFIYSHEAHRGGAGAAAFHGGNYAIPHMQYYRDQPLTYQDMRGPEFGDVDVLEKVIPAAARHGIKVFAFLLEDNVRPAAVPHWESMYEVDHHGRRSEKHPGGPCYNNPAYQNFTLGLVEDYARSYDIGGIMWGSERQSGLSNALCLSQSGGQDPGRATCFCEFCAKKGRERGIDAERARRGFGEVEKFIKEGRANRRPRDGYFSTFWRLVLNYPEVLAWANLWVTSRHELQAAIYRKVKSINPALQVGWHVWQNMSFSPFQRAEEDFGVLGGYSDFLRPAVYNRVAGGRFQTFVQGAHSAVFGDLSREETATLLYRDLNLNEAPYAQVASAGWSSGYVEREVRRVADGVAPAPTQIWPGVDIEDASGVTPESAADTVRAAFRGGAQGIILSRSYVDIKPENLSGAGRALRELGLI